MRLSRGMVRDPFRALQLLKNTYKNWLGITACYFARRPLGKAVLKNGLSIPLDRKPSSLRASLRHYHRWYDPSIYNLIGLARLLREGWEIKTVEPDYLVLSPDPSTLLKCRLNQGTDISLLGEIFVRGVYGSDFKGKTVVDVGAYTGDSAIFFSKRGARLVLALEPDPRNYQLAAENVKMNDLNDRVKLVNLALSVETGESKMEINLDTPNITQLESSDLKSVNTIAVSTVTVEELMSRYGLSSIDVLKMNCEGCEYGIMRNMPVGTLRSIAEILLEFHEGPKDLPEILTKNGFNIRVRGGTFGYIIAKRHPVEAA
jgi:FkbM family methyltransferase